MDNWPHQFTRTNQTQQIAENRIATLYYCTHCQTEWWQNKQPKPAGKCPARNDKREYRRLGVD